MFFIIHLFIKLVVYYIPKLLHPYNKNILDSNQCLITKITYNLISLNCKYSCYVFIFIIIYISVSSFNDVVTIALWIILFLPIINNENAVNMDVVISGIQRFAFIIASTLRNFFNRHKS